MIELLAMNRSASAKLYVDDVFSAYMRTGTGASATITTGNDISGKGGLVIVKSRSAATDWKFTDTARGVQKALISNSTAAESTDANGITAFGSTGHTVGTDTNYNNSGATYIDYEFCKASKFFDVVTYTGNGTYPRNISHNLGSTPGCIIVKKLSSISDWFVYHRSLSVDGTFGPYRILLNTTAAQSVNDDWKNAPTSTQFTVNNSDTNGNGVTYVAYLFAHNAGGFGATGSDNVISCGTFTASATETATVTLGYEPQWLLFKPTSTTGDWQIVDNMRRWPVASDAYSLKANLSAAEANFGAIKPSATGFYATSNLTANATYIYIAIRRGPMKTPTSGTSVFVPITATASTGTTRTVGFAADMLMAGARTIADYINTTDRLRGFAQTTTGTGFPVLKTALTNAETTIETPYAAEIWNTTARDGSGVNGLSTIWWYFGRAPGFFDVVCYTGTGSATTFNHNLTVVPELMIVKSRNNATNWAVYCAYLGGTNPANRYVLLNSSNSFGGTSVYWNDTAPTSTVFTVGTTAATNTSAYTYVNYLFATCAGVSKVGSYTGNGSNQTIDCGFSAGARFVLIKRTDSTGDWYIWDTVRGIVAGNDPHLSLNTTAAEVTTDDSIDTASSGFIVNQDAATNINVNTATYIFLAFA